MINTMIKKWSLAIIVTLLSITFFIGILNLESYISLGGIESYPPLKFGIAIGLLIITGTILSKIIKHEAHYGLILIKTQAPLDFIDNVAKKIPKQLNILSDIGMVMGFGLIGSYFVSKYEKDWKYLIMITIVGLALLTAIQLVMALYGSSLIASLITGVEMKTTTEAIQSIDNIQLIALVMNFMVYVWGISFNVMITIFGYALMIIINILNLLIFNPETTTLLDPGATPVLPGINLPLIEGILALAIILIVHEFSHGFLARVAKVKIESAGIALLGFVPVGAFVEPDEKALEKVSNAKHTRTLIAGPVANLYTCLITFIILIAFMTFAQGHMESNIVSLDNSSYNEEIVSINGININDIETFQFKANTTLNMTTITGTYLTETNGDGYLQLASISQFVEGYEWLRFFYNLIGLVLILNYLVGAINLIAIPGLDGQRILKINLNNDLIVTGLTYATIASFVANFLPWFFK